jgi:hypothetical protein
VTKIKENPVDISVLTYQQFEELIKRYKENPQIEHDMRTSSCFNDDSDSDEKDETEIFMEVGDIS